MSLDVEINIMTKHKNSTDGVRLREDSRQSKTAHWLVYSLISMYVMISISYQGLVVFRVEGNCDIVIYYIMI